MVGVGLGCKVGVAVGSGVSVGLGVAWAVAVSATAVYTPEISWSAWEVGNAAGVLPQALNTITRTIILKENIIFFMDHQPVVRELAA